MYAQSCIIILSCMHRHTLGSQCKEKSIRLIGELSQAEGVVAICLGGSWGKVCGSVHFFEGFNFIQNAAAVVCKQLGFSSESNY